MEKESPTSVAQELIVVLNLINTKHRQRQPLTLLKKLLLSILCFKIVVAMSSKWFRGSHWTDSNGLFLELKLILCRGEFRSPMNILTL